MKREFCLNTVPPRMFEACIFDFDGVITDTEKYHYRAWQYACEPLGIDFSEEEYLPLRSTGRERVANFFERKIARSLSQSEKELLFSRKQAKFEELTQDIGKEDLIGGVLPFLQMLRKQNIPAAVATSSSQAARIMEKFSLYPYFEQYVDSKEIARKKPFPDIYLKTANLLGIPPQNCLVFEDSGVGVEAAVSAGMSVVTVGPLCDARAIKQIKDFTELN